MALRGISVRKRISRIELKRAFQKCQRFGRWRRHPRINVRLRLQDQIIGVEAVRPFALDALDLRESQARLDRANNGQCELVLKGENIVELTIVTLGPNVRSDCGVDELPGYAHAI